MKHSVSHYGKHGNTHLYEFGRVKVWIHTYPFRLALTLGRKLYRII